MEFQKVMCLSTAHVTADDMNERLPETDPGQAIFSLRHEYGAMVYIPQEQEGVEELVEAAYSFGYSDSFLKVLRWGFQHGCRYVHLDCDGPIEVWPIMCGYLDDCDWQRDKGVKA